MSFHLAFLPYYALIVIVGLVTFIRPLREASQAITLTFFSPATVTALGWKTDAARSTLPIFGHPGALILYAAVLAAVLFARLGRKPQWGMVWKNAGTQGVPATITILALVGVAMVMVYTRRVGRTS